MLALSRARRNNAAPRSKRCVRALKSTASIKSALRSSARIILRRFEPWRKNYFPESWISDRKGSIDGKKDQRADDAGQNGSRSGGRALHEEHVHHGQRGAHRDRAQRQRGTFFAAC